MPTRQTRKEPAVATTGQRIPGGSFRAVQPDNWNKKTILRVLIALSIMALGLRLWGLTRQSLWIDETFSLGWAHLWDTYTLEAFRINLQGPVHALLLHLWCRLFGNGELPLRLLHALVSTATIPLLFFAARPVFGDRRSLLGAALLAINPFHIWYAQEVRNYSFVIFLSIVGIVLIQRLDRLERVRGTFGLAVSWILGLLCNLSMGFHVVAVGLWGLGRFRRRGRALILLLLSGVVTLVVLLPWGFEFYQRRISSSHLLKLESVPSEQRLRGNAAEPILGLPYALYSFSAGFSLGPSLRELRRSRSIETIRPYAVPIVATGLVFGILSVAGLAGWIRGDNRRRLWLFLLIVPFALAFIAATRNLKVFNPRYVAVALPAYVMLLSEGISILKPRVLGAVLLAGVVLLSGISIVQLQTVSRYWKSDARAATGYLRENLQPGDLLFVSGTRGPIERYYWRDLPERSDLSIDYIPHRVGPESSGRAAATHQAIRSAREAFVLFYRDDFQDPEGKWESFLREHYTIAESWETTGIRIWRLGEGVRP